MKKSFLILSVILLLTLQSCDCEIAINGYVIDSKTKNPVENVHIYLKMDNSIQDDFGIFVDSLIDTKRKELIAQNGNMDNWMEETYSNKMYRQVPLKTDSLGFFNLYWFTGMCPDYKLKIEKVGYETLTIDRDEISNGDTITVEMKIN